MNHVNGDMRICVTLEEQEDTVKITVANTGDPIPEDSLDKYGSSFIRSIKQEQENTVEAESDCLS